MPRRSTLTVFVAVVAATAWAPSPEIRATSPASPPAAPDGWQATAPREEIRPKFGWVADGGPDGHGALVIEATESEGLHGRWSKAFPITGGQGYTFRAYRSIGNIPVP